MSTPIFANLYVSSIFFLDPFFQCICLFFLILVCFCFILLHCCSLDACLLRTDRKDMDLEGKEGGEDL